MAKIRGEEAWAAECIRMALVGVEVTYHDDGSSPGMYDLDIRHPGGTRGAVEVTAAADAESIELWNLINPGRRWVEPDLDGGWGVSVLPNARAKDLRTRLPLLIKELEAAGIREVRVGSRRHERLEEIAASLNVSCLSQGETEYAGSIYPTIRLPPERSGGYVASTGDALADWVTEWIAQPSQQSNVSKLRASGADERHFFLVFPGFADAPFVVADLLMRPDAPLPTIDPRLPEGITHVWTMSTWDSGVGIRWSPTGGWESFEKPTPKTR